MKKKIILAMLITCMCLVSACNNATSVKIGDTQQNGKSSGIFSKIKNEAKGKANSVMNNAETTSEQKKSKIKVNDNVKKQVNGQFEKVLTAISSKNKDGLYQLFSIDGQMQGSDFDKGESYVFDLLQGNLVRWKTDVMEESIIYASFTEIYAWYTLETDQGKYRIFMSTYIKNEADEKDVGLYALRMIKAEDENKGENKFFSVPELMDDPGIYIPSKDDDMKK